MNCVDVSENCFDFYLSENFLLDWLNVILVGVVQLLFKLMPKQQHAVRTYVKEIWQLPGVGVIYCDPVPETIIFFILQPYYLSGGTICDAKI